MHNLVLRLPFRFEFEFGTVRLNCKCHGFLVHWVNIAVKFTRKWQETQLRIKQISLPKHYIKRYKQQKMNFEKLLG